MPKDDLGLSWHVLSVPKNGHSNDEYEDAWACDPAAGRFALADGASESSFAGLWARLLVEGFVAAAATAKLAAWLEQPRRRWAEEVMRLELPWFGEMKRDQGAYATLLGLDLQLPTSTEPGVWRVEVVGDSCIVQIRKNKCVHSFPILKSAEFGNQPNLVGSRDGEAEAQHLSDSLLVGDTLLLMTDALAHWFLRTHERRGRPWEAFAELLAEARPEEEFAVWVEGLRAAGALRNDDVTLLSITIPSGSKTKE